MKFREVDLAAFPVPYFHKISSYVSRVISESEFPIFERNYPLRAIARMRRPWTIRERVLVPSTVVSKPRVR